VRILGIDPGLNTTGFGVIDIPDEHYFAQNEGTLVEAGCFRLGDASRSIAHRLTELESDVSVLIQRTTPQWMCIESLFSHSRFPRTSITMAHARGVILLVAQRLGIDITEVSPAEAKKSLTGNGRATKAQVQNAVMRTLRLTTPPEPLDVSDALAIALSGARRINSQALLNEDPITKKVISPQRAKRTQRNQM